ncbi:MAG TPA: hypothetical protein VFI49_03875 [Rudaea sp.]|nr:hypothetical protein [Rudaea sp.]
MKLLFLLALYLLAAASTATAATKCPFIDAALLNRGLPDSAPWRVMSGGQGECSFTAKDMSVSFGFSHMVSESTEKATDAAKSMKEAVTPTSRVEPLPVLGEYGIDYNMKNDKGMPDEKSMFFYGHSGRVGVSGYLNLKDAITSQQRDFAANLIASTLGVAGSARALKKETSCPYFEDSLVKSLLPSGDMTISIPNKDSCVVSASGSVLMVSANSSAQSAQAVSNMLKGSGCTVDPLPKFGKVAGIAHHCSGGNPRAQILFVSGGRMFDVTLVPTSEPTEAQRATLVELAEYAAKH